MGLIVKKQKVLDQKFWIAFDKLVIKNFRYCVQMNSIWIKAFAESYLSFDRLFIISIYDEDELVGCLPLQINEVRATRFWNSFEEIFFNKNNKDLLKYQKQSIGLI